MAARYTDAEVEEILRRAIERQRDDAGKLSHEDLVAAAGEIGIDAKDVEAAVAEVRGSATAPVRPAAATAPARAAAEADAGEDEDDETLLSDDSRSRRASFVRHLVTFLVVNGALAGMNVLTGGPWWFLWVVLGWGIGVALQAVGLVMPEGPQGKKNRLRRLRRRRERERRKDRVRERRVDSRQRQKERKKDFERVVQEGVGLLLTTAARKIEDAVERARIEEERRKSGVRVQVDGDHDRVRVEVPEDDAEVAVRGKASDPRKEGR